MDRNDDSDREVLVEADGAVRIITLNRPDQLNAVNHALHEQFARVLAEIHEDLDAAAVVITGNGRAFCAGGDLSYIDEQIRDEEYRKLSLLHGKLIVERMVACRVPIVAAVNGPAVGLGCSLVALSDIVYMARRAYLSDPHVGVGLVAADGGALSWPLAMSLHLAKEYALTGERIPAERAAQIGLANHVVDDDSLLDAALGCAKRIAALPREAVEGTRRALNLHLEQALRGALDFALGAEHRSFDSPEVRANVDRFMSGG